MATLLLFCEMATFLEKLRSSPSNRAMRLFAQPPRWMQLWFLAKLSMNYLETYQVCGNQCGKLQEHALFRGKPVRPVHLARNQPDNLQLHYVADKRVNLRRLL